MDWFSERIKESGDRIAVIYQDKSYSYADLYKQIEEIYGQIAGHISSGETVAVLSDYSFGSIALFFALYQNRNIIVPITTKVEAEIKDKLEISRCRFVIRFIDSKLCIEECKHLPEIYPLVDGLIQSGRAGLILFSSGSTGRPKAMVHDLNNLIDSYRDKKGKSLVFMIFLMFDHIGGLNTMLNCLSMGVSMVFPSSRDAEHVASLVEKYKINVLPASPTFLNLILISEAYRYYDMSSIRMITYGTEPMPDSLLVKLKGIFPRVKFLQTFGTSETGISQTSSRSSDSTFLKISDPDTEYKIVDGELWLRTKTQIMGYLNSSMEKFTQDGWFKTGDLVEEAGDGFIRIVGRNSEVINVGGEKVLPSEVESVLFQLEGVKDCLVYGERNPIMGQMVVAKILFEDDIKVRDAKRKVTVFCQDKLERYKIPAKVVLMTHSEYTDRFKKKRLN